MSPALLAADFAPDFVAVELDLVTDDFEAEVFFAAVVVALVVLDLVAFEAGWLLAEVLLEEAVCAFVDVDFAVTSFLAPSSAFAALAAAFFAASSAFIWSRINCFACRTH